MLDVRNFAEHAAGHLPGAINVPVSGGSFGTKAGFVLEPGESVVLHAASAERGGRRGAHALGGRHPRARGLRRSSLHATETLATVDRTS